MAYSNWKNPLDEDDEDPTYWYEGFQQAGKSAVDSFGKSMGVFWKDMTNGSLKRGLKEQGNLLASAYRGPQVPQPVKPNYNPGGYSQDTLKVMAKADRMYQQATTGFNRIMPPANMNAGIINRYNYYENQKTPLSAQKRVGTMGETYGTTENKLWQKAKIGSMGETYNASTAIQRYNTAYTNFKDWLKSTTVTTGYSAPPTTSAGSGYGGGYYYGGGGGGSYKPTPSPWYMELTNWKI